MGPSSVIGCQAIRVARLGATGAPDYNNSTGGFMLCSGISTFAWDWVKNEGEDLYVLDAAGNPCVIRKKDDSAKRVTFTLTMCRSDYRLDEIFDIADAVLDGSNVVGRAFTVGQGCGTSTTRHGVTLELWSEQWDCDDALASAPYMRKVLPKCFIMPAGSTLENGVSMPVYTGFSVPNDNFGDGPFGDLDLLSSMTGWAMVDIDNTVIPACPGTIGYINIPGSAS